MEADAREVLSRDRHRAGGGITGRGGRPSSSTWDPLDDALKAYWSGDRGVCLTMRTDVGGGEEVPVRLFFRGADELVALERTALDLCRGKVLDLGAGVGALSVLLLQRGQEVAASELLPTARRILQERGVPVVDALGESEAVGEGVWDTVLLMMNGLGLAGTLAGLGSFLGRLSRLLAPGGRIVADSTDPTTWEDVDDGRRPGEVHMQLGFRDRWGDPFPFLFVSPAELTARAAEVDLRAQVVATEKDGRFLALMRRERDPG